MFLRSLIKMALSLAAAETARRQVGRWLKGEISIQDLWDRAWRGPTCHIRVRHLPFRVYCSLQGGEESSR